MRTIGNLIWFLFGGICMGLAWCFFGLLAFISIVGIPWGRACLVMAGFSFFPFGKEAIGRDELTLKEDIGTSEFGVVGNVIWFVFAGFWLALGHVISAICCFITIIGIPFAIQHLKLAGISIAPIGKTVVSKELAAAARQHRADIELQSMRANR
ncbi:YccF domain-containing protein [Thalassotalea litorea]|uniref:YccF domain-containing protein n=1 Tax=Thalassotalea litorea TaxID=2020715 RepID=UPI0037357B33